MTFNEFLNKHQKVTVEEFPNQISDNPLVSVCIQTYQHAPYIQDCLDSILMQKTTFPFEILLGEDDSTDGTREICIDYAKKYSDKIRLFLHRRENNIEILGTPTGRFNSLYNFYTARGKYLAFCEGDDYWTDPEKLQKQFDFMSTHPEYSICGHDAFILEDGKIIKESKLPESQKKDFKSTEVQKGIFVLTLSAFFKNTHTYPYECLNVINFDTFLFAYIGQFGHYKYMGNIKPACYRRHDGGMWSSNAQIKKELSDLHTQFWISKYYERQNLHNLKDHFGINVTKKSITFLVNPTWRNYAKILKHMLSIKFPKANRQISLIKRRIGVR